MNPEFWISRWEKNMIGFHQPTANPQLVRYYDRLGLKGGDRVFVPLCGKSLDMIWLREQGVNVLGVEMSALAVRSFFEENGMMPEIELDGKLMRYRSNGIELLNGDFFAVKKSDLAGIAAVYDRAALIALPEPMRARYARRMAELLPSGARVLLITIDYPQGEMDGPPFAVSHAETRRLFEESFEIELLESHDVLQENERFIQRGVTRLEEMVYVMEKR